MLGGKISLSGITNVIGVFKIAWEVLKEVDELVQTVEEADTDDGEKNGEKKKEAVLDVIEAVYNVAEDTVEVPVEKDTILNLADNGVEIFVDVYNVIGKFRSKSE